MIKYFRFDFDYVMWGIGYTNLIMLLATIPVYESEEEKKEKPIDFGGDVNALANFINNIN